MYVRQERQRTIVFEVITGSCCRREEAKMEAKEGMKSSDCELNITHFHLHVSKRVSRNGL